MPYEVHALPPLGNPGSATELGIVFGKAGKNIPEDKTLSYILMVTLVQ